MDIASWLRDLGLERYEDAFRDNEIDAEILPTLSSDDLKDLGVSIVGHRRKLLNAIANLKTSEIDAAAEASSVNPVQPIATTPAREAERRQLTVMFIDMVGSTALAGRLDPEDMGQLVRAYQERCAEVIKRWDGHVAKYMGDGVLAYFGWPKAHEDDAERAVRAGLEVARAIGELTIKDSAKLAARVGIATGQVMVGDLVGEGAAQEEAVVGETPNLAARLQSLATPGQVVIAPGTRRLLGDVFELPDLGRKSVKGIAEPVRAFAVGGERVVGSRFEARRGELLPMEGRDQELALLLERWAQAKAGEGQGVLLVGEAGIGKSRISRALLDAIADESHTRIRYQCSPYHSDSALWPIIQQLRQAARFAGDEPDDAKLDKLEVLLAQANCDVQQAAPIIADLIGLDYEARYGDLGLAPQVQRLRTLELLVEQLLGLAAVQPVLVLLEDAHWIDPTTLELIEQSLDRISAARVLIVLTSRPDQQPEIAAHPHITRLTLNRLGSSGVKAIVARLGGEDLSQDVVDTIIARTDGVPLFVEELTKAVLETGQPSVPASLHDSLMARLDRLPDVREVAQIAACIGREFSYSLLAAVGGRPEPGLATTLERLAAAELVFRRGTLPAATYTFKHALVRDAAYQSLLRSKRQELHAKIAEVLEARFQNTVEAQPELLGHHFTEADLTGPAIRYWRRAAERAIQKSANLEAIKHYKKALNLVATLPPTPDRDQTEVDLQLGLGAALIAPKSYAAEEVRDAFARAEMLCRKTGDPTRRFRALRGLWSWHLLRTNLDEASRLSGELLSLAEQSGETARQLMARRVAGTTNCGLGKYQAAREHFARGLDLYDPSDHDHYVLLYGEDPGLFCYMYSAWTDDWLGHRNQALSWLKRGLQVARDQANQYSLSIVLVLSAFVYIGRREPEEARLCAEEAILVSQEQGVAQWLAIAQVYHGWTLAAVGDVNKGVDQTREGVRAAYSLGTLYAQTLNLVILADIYRMSGEYEAGLKALDEVDGIIRHVGYGQWIPELYRLRGDIQILDSRPAEAEEQFNKAIKIACNQNAKSLQLRAAVSLARLWCSQGKGSQARDLLAPIFGWFTEGFDTSDLMEAKALLDKLS